MCSQWSFSWNEIFKAFFEIINSQRNRKSKTTPEWFQNRLPQLLRIWLELNGFALRGHKYCKKIPIKLQAELVSSCVECGIEKEEENALKLTVIRNYALMPTKPKMKDNNFELAYNFVCPKEEKEVNRIIISPLSNKGHTIEYVATFICTIMKVCIESIEFEDFSHCNWTKSEIRERKSPTILKAINFFNYITARLSTDIVLPESLNDRVDNLKRAIDIAQEAYRLKNFDVLSAIVSGLNSCACSQTRLKLTWQNLPKKYSIQFGELEEIVSPVGNYGTYRTTLTNLIDVERDSSWVPMLAVILRDVVSVDATNSDISPISGSSSSVNIDKLILLGKAIYPLFLVKNNAKFAHVNLPASFTEFLFNHDLQSAAPAEENLLQNISYIREPPKNCSLLSQDLPEAEQLSRRNSAPSSVSVYEKPVDQLCNKDKIEIIRRSYQKVPDSWNTYEVLINLESWGIPENICVSLVLNGGPLSSGEKLVELVANKNEFKSTIKQLGYRKQIARQLKSNKERHHKETSCGDSVGNQNKSVWTVNAVVDWISSYEELAPYAHLFDENNIDGAKLLELTSTSMLTIGIKVLRHRKLLTQYINSNRDRIRLGVPVSGSNTFPKLEKSFSVS